MILNSPKAFTKAVMSRVAAMFGRRLAAGLARLKPDEKQMLVAVSGGADSVALLHGLLHLRAEIGLNLTVAHFDHGLRAGSAADASWVQELAQKWGVPCIVGAAATGQIAPAGGGWEASARNARYQFLQEAAAKVRAKVVVTAHTASDQAETVLHHLCRGTGLSGLSGMPRQRPLGEGVVLLRPMLQIPRAMVEAYLAEQQVEFLVDETNASDLFTRNRIRRNLLPTLKAEFPQVESSLLKIALTAKEQSRYVVKVAARLRAKSQLPAVASVDSVAQVVGFRIDLLKRKPAVILKALFANLWRSMGWPRGQLSHDHFRRLVKICRHQAGEWPKGEGGHFPGGVFVWIEHPHLFFRVSPAEPGLPVANRPAGG
jgi:tRNA(Ile)-lysidine synthase